MIFSNKFDMQEIAHFEKNFELTELILILLAKSQDQCLSFSQLKEKLDIDERILRIYLSRLMRKNKIFSMKKSEKEKEKIYCLNI